MSWCIARSTPLNEEVIYPHAVQCIYIWRLLSRTGGHACTRDPADTQYRPPGHETLTSNASLSAVIRLSVCLDQIDQAHVLGSLDYNTYCYRVAPNASPDIFSELLKSLVSSEALMSELVLISFTSLAEARGDSCSIGLWIWRLLIFLVRPFMILNPVSILDCAVQFWVEWKAWKGPWSRPIHYTSL